MMQTWYKPSCWLSCSLNFSMKRLLVLGWGGWGLKMRCGCYAMALRLQEMPPVTISLHPLRGAAWPGPALSICWLELQAAVPRIACTHHYLKQKKTLIGVGRAAAARMEKWNETISEHRGNELAAVLVCPDHNISHFSPQRTFLVPPAARRRRRSNDSLIKFWHWLVTAAWCRYWEGRTLDTWCRPAQVTVVSGHSCRHLCMASVVTRSHLWASLVTTCGHLANVRTLGVAQWQCAMACVMCVQCVYYCVMLIMPSCAQHYLAHR